MATTYHLYITNKNYSSWSLRPWLLLRTLGIPFVEQLRPIVPGPSYSQPQWREFSPIGHVPCLHVLPAAPGEGEEGRQEPEPPIMLWESIAMVEFLAEAHPDKAVYPCEARARAWARSATAEMHSGFAALRWEMGMNVGVRIELTEEAFTDELVGDLRRVDELWAEGLGRFGGPFLAGREFTAVDAFFAPVVLRLETYVGALDRMGAAAKGYVEHMLGLEGVVQWCEQALLETWRDPLHDRECLEGKGRKLIADFRA